MTSCGWMQQRLPSLLDPPVGFAHRGAKAHAPENTLESFSLALRLGATGLESDVWVTKDDIAVLDHDGVVRKGLRRLPIATFNRDELPEHIPSVAELFANCGTDFHLSLDVKAPEAYDATARAIRGADADMPTRTWLCDPVLANLETRRDELHDFKLVHSTRLGKLPHSPERHAASLAAASIDAMNMHYTDWNGGLVALFHRFSVIAMSWDMQFDYQLENGLRMGIDAVFSDHTDIMMSALEREAGPQV